MSSTLQHFSHDHPLELKESDVFENDPKCCMCNNRVIGSPTYTCSDSASNNTECRIFYLHKTCAELPSQINFHKHNQHPLDLLPRPDGYYCDVCEQDVKFCYACDDCEVNVCVVCAFQQRVLHHEGHPEHILTLMPRKFLFRCDACYEKTEDSSYVCTTCDFCIHKECALSPFSIPAPTYHHHPLDLIYSVPKMHRYFHRFCNICLGQVHTSYWMYYCHKCTYFVHMTCATSSHTSCSVNEIEEEGTLNDEPDLIELPLDSEESLFDLIISQCCKLQVESQGENGNSTMILMANDPHLIREHWSHQVHPLVQLQINISENNEENNYDKRVLICDGCIQPITLSHPSYYACSIKCGFFLHSFCATKLPEKLLAGICSFHPQHPLLLSRWNRIYRFAVCEVCSYDTNGFYYFCETCNITIDIRCAFLPKKIKHKSHKHHSLILRPYSDLDCSVSGYSIASGAQYECETCSKFHIDIDSAFYPCRMKHRFNDHPITLRQPPFFYEGVIYCEICEFQVNNQWWLYHCDECDHSFHHTCFRFGSVKLGGSIEVDINDQSHTLTLVFKRRSRNYCRYCGVCFIRDYFLECDGCGYLICCPCGSKIKASNKSIHF